MENNKLEQKYIAPIETYKDGTLWIKCIKEEPKKDKIRNGLRVYHGDATSVSSWDGADDKYTCPHCGVSWWVEYD